MKKRGSIMNGKGIHEDSTRILLAAITGPINPIKSILNEAKEKINVEDIRFRLRDWQDQSVVYMPEWIIGAGLEEAEPELARRVYYDPDNPSRIDCMVGLVARIARINEEELKEKKDHDLIRKLKEGIAVDEINIEKIRFNNVANQRAFKEFLERLKENTKKWLEMAMRWEEYLKYLEKNKNSPSFFSEAIGPHAPWINEDNAEKKKEQWLLLEKYLKEWRKGSDVKGFLEMVDKTVKRYKRLHQQWKDYTAHAEIPKCEIAVPVVAFGKFLGVLNFHKENEFTEHDEQLARTYAAQLSVACLQRQTELFEEFQRVARIIAAKNNFEEIASKIAEGIRKGLRDGLKEAEVFPLLYVASQPISRFDELTDEEFEKRWKNAYHRRQQPLLEEEKDLAVWNTENILGPIPIRRKGLGRAIIEKWRKLEEKSNKGVSYLFIDAIDVDDPNSETGSRSALQHNIKTTGCLPLVFEDQVYGLLYLHCKKRHFFTDAEVHALDTSGIQAAIAINNARLTGNSYETLYGKKILDLLIGGK